MQKIRIDFDNPGLPQHISAVENDSQSRFFQATLYENGKAYTAPAGASYSIMYRGFGHQNQGWYDTINDGAGKRAACTASGNVVTCEIARQALQVPGHVSIVLCVTTGKGYMLKSWPIECDCKNDRYDSTVEIQSFFYITQISNESWTQAIQAVEELKNTIDPTLSLSGKAADAAKVGEAVNAESERAKGVENQLKEDLGDIENATTVTISSKNLLNINDLDFLKNKILALNGAEIVNENNSTTGFISCKSGDNFVLGYATSPLSQELTRQNPVFVYLFDKNKNFLSRSPQYPAVDSVYTVDSENARYIRMTAANSFFSNDYIMLAKANTNLPFEVYFAPYKILKNQSDVEELKSDVEELKSDVDNVNKYIIDCWGDSRTAMIADDGTSYCDYLKALLGSEFHVQNYGESSQSSGMCAARFGSNELFMTFPDNKLNASGATNLSAIECTSGNDRNVYEYSKSRYIYGSLNGVYGRFERASIASFDNVKFTRISDGLEVPIKPRTKLVVDDVSQREHINIFWWGKNDFASALKYIVSGVIDNYDKAVKWLGHKYFIILGETCSLTSSYEVGGSDRIKLDEINNTLKKKYPNNFIDINEYLSSEQALTDVGLTITDADTENISKGFPCEQLMVHITNQSDTVHPNEKGREAIAHKIYEFMQNKGWITS